MKAIELAGYDALRTEQAARRRRGDRLQLGIGVSTYVEVTAGGMSTEYGSVEVHEDGVGHRRRRARPPTARATPRPSR